MAHSGLALEMFISKSISANSVHIVQNYIQIDYRLNISAYVNKKLQSYVTDEQSV